MMLIPSIWQWVVVLGWVWPISYWIVRYSSGLVFPCVPGRTSNLMYNGWLLSPYSLATHRWFTDLFLFILLWSSTNFRCCLLLCQLLGYNPMSCEAKLISLFYRLNPQKNSLATNVRPLIPKPMLLIPSIWWVIVVLGWVSSCWPDIVRYWPWHLPLFVPGCTQHLMYYGWLLCQYELITHRGLNYLFPCTSSTGFRIIRCCLLFGLLLGCRPMSSHAPFHHPKSNENHSLLTKNECHFHPPPIEITLPYHFIVVLCLLIHPGP